METGTARSIAVHQDGLSDRDDRVTEQRIASLVRLSSELKRERSLYKNERERLDASLMTAPINSRKAFEYFGLVIGTLPPFAVLFKIISESAPGDGGVALFILLIGAAGIMTGVAGYLFGRFIPGAIAQLDGFRQPNRAAMLSLIGAGWGATSGAIGGIFLFVIGSVFAAIVGGLVGAITLPLFVTLHSSVRVGDLVEMKHFLPISLGISLTLCALVLGF